MGLKNIADRLDAALSEATDKIQQRQERIVESDERKMAHHIVAYALEQVAAGTDPRELGAAVVQGAVIGEDESGGYLAEPVVQFLESMLAGAKSALSERFGADNITYDPVQHCVQYMLSHNRWPESASPGVIAKAKAAMAAGRRGAKKGPAFGTYL